MRKMQKIGLIAHDNKKIDILEWAVKYQIALANYALIGTEGTAKLITGVTNLPIESMGAGPEGGDVKIAFKILEHEIDALIFFVDPLHPHGHEHDIQTLIRTCIATNIPLALNEATACFLFQL